MKGEGAPCPFWAPAWTGLFQVFVLEILECLLIVWWNTSRSRFVIYEVFPLRPITDRRVEGMTICHASTSSALMISSRALWVFLSWFMSRLPYHLRKSLHSSWIIFKPSWPREKSTVRESPSWKRTLTSCDVKLKDSTPEKVYLAVGFIAEKLIKFSRFVRFLSLTLIL